MGDKISVRRATIEDATGIADLMVRGDWLQAIMTGVYEHLRAQVDGQLRNQAEGRQLLFFVAEQVPGLVIGYAAARVLGQDSGVSSIFFVEELFAAPLSTAAEIDSKLLRALSDEAACRGIRMQCGVSGHERALDSLLAGDKGARAKLLVGSA